MITIGSVILYRLLYSATIRRKTGPPESVAPASSAKISQPITNSASLWTAGSFAGVIAVATFSMGSAVNSLVSLALNGLGVGTIAMLSLSLAGVGLSVLMIAYLLYRLELNSGNLKRRVKMFEVGWRGD